MIYTTQTRARVAERAFATEVRLLRSSLFSIIGEDREGRYRPSFVRAILGASREKPTKTFTDVATFLRDIEQA